MLESEQDEKAQTVRDANVIAQSSLLCNVPHLSGLMRIFH